MSGDGKPWTLASMGVVLGVTRERVRQLRERAFEYINENLARRLASASRLRAALTKGPSSTDYRDPEATVALVVKYVTSHFAAAKQLTIMCCKAAGNHGSKLEDLPGLAAAKACSKPELLGKWRLDRWKDAAERAIGPFRHFQAPPDDLIGRKRLPAAPRDPNNQLLRSQKLRRDVACESGSELRVFSWIERSPEVRWYQEQPAVLRYTLAGRERPYFPDVAVLDQQGRIVIVEVKPLYNMYREETLAKAIAALNLFGARGIGYLLIDPSGHTLADLAHVSYDQAAADQVETMFEHGPVSYGTVIRKLSQLGARTDLPSFGSIVVNRDWAVTTDSPVRVSKLPRGQSFRALLGRGAARSDGHGSDQR
jgi:hypothetical protein